VKGCIICVLLLGAGGSLMAQGDLLISPQRIMFEGNRKSQEINLANVGKDTATYSISVVDYRMTDDGGFEEIKEPDPGQRFAGPFLRFFPRKVTLAPNEAQVVKVQLIKTNELTTGEYRSHLYFRAVPDEKPLGEAPAKKDSGISIHLTPIFGITIPVIIRSGECKADVTLSDLSFSADNTPLLHMVFNRTGNISVYGDLTVDHISPSGKTTQVRWARGIGIYSTNKIRRTDVELDTDKNVDFHKGKLHISYTVQTGDKTVKNVEADVALH